MCVCVCMCFVGLLGVLLGALAYCLYCCRLKCSHVYLRFDCACIYIIFALSSAGASCTLSFALDCVSNEAAKQQLPVQLVSKIYKWGQCESE